MAANSKIRVRFAVERDEQAAKITALLEALGYEVVRDLDHGTPQNRLRWAVARLRSKAQLTEREADILTLVLQGRSNGEISDELGISKATVKWHMHNVFTKTGTATREALLREALQLGGVTRRASDVGDDEPEPIGGDPVEAIEAIEVEDGIEDDG